ncbi:MAG: hypothetical protein KGO94_12780 [Alphaproteobacteria bacterium]|nr:hypothetical protein [Alphaproteobacteria bacterium]
MRNTSANRKLQSPAALPHLAEKLAGLRPILRKYLGATKFNRMTQALDSRYPALPVASMAAKLAEFLRHHPDYQRCRELTELAELEYAFISAHEASPPNLLHRFAPTARLVASAQILNFSQNTTSIWSALHAGELPPKPHQLGQSQSVLVWRQGKSPRFRLLGEEEASLLKRLRQNIVLPKDQALPYTIGWLSADLLESGNTDFLK